MDTGAHLQVVVMFGQRAVSTTGVVARLPATRAPCGLLLPCLYIPGAGPGAAERPVFSGEPLA